VQREAAVSSCREEEAGKKGDASRGVLNARNARVATPPQQGS